MMAVSAEKQPCRAGARTVYIQGDDFKARLWTAHFSVAVRHFKTVYDVLQMLWTTRRGDVVIHRYQNCPRRLGPTLLLVMLQALLQAKARLAGIKIVWICHNVDQDTSPHHKWLERIRRGLLARFADCVFVLDPAFVPHCPRPNARAISFGEKPDGTIGPENLAAIQDLAASVDRVILIAGQDGGKYKAFGRIPEIDARFAAAGYTVGFVAAGMSADRHFASSIEARILRIEERNIRERDLHGLVDYIYRENADISMPYTIYAAATAKIPVLTAPGNVLAEIVRREGLGLTLDDELGGVNRHFNFEGFLQRHRWDSLRDALREIGIPV
jgi:hypothetical protein